MTYKEAKSYLEQIRQTEQAMARLELTIEQISCSLLPGAIRYDIDKVKSSAKDNLSETIIKLDELKRELNDKYRAKGEYLREIYQNIEILMPEDTEEEVVVKNVITMYYIARMSCREIGEDSKINYSERHCWRLRNKGIRIFAEKWTEREQKGRNKNYGKDKND